MPLDRIALLELLRHRDPLPIGRFRQVGSTTVFVAAAKTTERRGEVVAGLIAERFEEVAEDCGGFTNAAGLQQLFAAVRLRQIPCLRTGLEVDSIGAVGKPRSFAGQAEVAKEPVDGVYKIDRVGIAGVQCTIDGLKQIGQFATGDGPDLMRVLDVFVVEVVRQSVVPLAVGGGQGLTLVGLQARPKDRGQRGMEAKKRGADARNALGFDQGRRFQLPTQAGPDRGVSFQLAILDFGRLEACFNLHDG